MVAWISPIGRSGFSTVSRAIEDAQHTLATVLTKASFWEAHVPKLLDERRVKIFNRPLDGFERKLTSSKWATMNHCSQDTADREFPNLFDRGTLVHNPAGGRTTGGELDADETPQSE